VSENTGEESVQKKGLAMSGDEAEMRWYVVHTYSGHESRAQASLLERVRAEGLEDHFDEVLIPTESVIEMRKGQKRTTTRKFFPGYMFVRMKLTRQTWHLVKGTPKITGFLGGNNPSPVPDREINHVKKQETEGAEKPKPKVLFEEGETVRVTDGPFSNFSGIVEEVKPEKQKIRVLVSIFGRATPVELDFTQVEKS
jgi:transcriptional antiterminator NusG